MKVSWLSCQKSFRLRVALLSALVSGIALALFMSLSLAALHKLSLQRMDSDIREFAHKHLIRPEGTQHWKGLADALKFFLGDEQEDTFILLVEDRDGAVLYASPNWPRELPAEAIPPADEWGRYTTSTPDPVFAKMKKVPRNGPGPRNNRGTRDDDPTTSLPLKVPEFSTREAAGIRWRVGMMGNPDTTIMLGLNMRRLNEEMAQVRTSLLLVFPLALFVVAVGAWWISQRALRPLEAVTRTIRQVKAKGLDQRVSSQEEDREFAELISHFNDLMGWLEKSFQQAVRFSADASHELKTPLTLLQVQVERAVQEAECGSQEQRRYVAFGNELQRLKSITEKLLLLARIDAGELRLALRPVDLSELIEGAVEDAETLAPHLAISSDIAPDVWVMADSDLLKQVVQNLVSNAIKFNHSEGEVRFALLDDERQVQFITENSGAGIPPEDKEKLFTRFYRADKARERRVGGAGLGLSLAREIARAHYGELTLRASSSSVTIFVLTLPRMVAGRQSACDHEAGSARLPES